MIIKEIDVPGSQQQKIRFYKLSVVLSPESYYYNHVGMILSSHFSTKFFLFIDNIKRYIQLESCSVHIILHHEPKIFLSAPDNFDPSFILRVEQ